MYMHMTTDLWVALSIAFVLFGTLGPKVKSRRKELRAFLWRQTRPLISGAQLLNNLLVNVHSIKLISNEILLIYSIRLVDADTRIFSLKRIDNTSRTLLS